MSIINLLNQIKRGEVVLPAIQRDFVWSEDRVTMLLDSIMRGYPVGIVLLWETYQEIQFRRFDDDYKPGTLYAFHDNSKKEKLKVVLDGQQRLQSLFVALYGTYAGKSLYLDVLSGRDTDDFRQEKYDFELATTKDANAWNELTLKQLASKQQEEDLMPRHFVKVNDLFAMGVQERQKFRRALGKELGLDEEDDLRVETNLARFDEVMTKDENILKASVIDENRPPDSPERKTEADVLEIFVRINRQGMPLSRSDLIFSMLKLNWKESAEALPEFVQRINEGNSFKLDNDFVIRCLFAVCDLGTRFDLDLLRTKSNVQIMQARFQQCCDAIASTLDFVTRECWCQSSTVMGGSATLIPFVYYLFHLPKHQVPNSQISNVRKAVYLFGFTQPFSRYADSRLGAFLRKELKGRAEDHDAIFPLEDATYWIRRWERISGFGEELLQENPTLTLHLVQQQTGTKTHYVNNAPEIDHIFPRSVLREKGYHELQVEHFANLWILPKGKNQNKSDKHPAKYLKEVSDADLKRALIDRKMLDYRRYSAFLKERSKAIQEAIQGKLDISDADFWHEDVQSTPELFETEPV